MPISDPAAVRFVNERVRVAADKLAQAYYFAKIVVDEWNATGMGSRVLNEVGNVIQDGAKTDGRNPIDGADATNIITRLQEMIADFESAGGAKLNTVRKVSVNPDRGSLLP